MKKVIIVAVVIGILLLLGVGAAYYWYNSAISTPASSSKDKVVFEIKQGESADTIATNLAASGLLKEKEAFLIYAKLNPDTYAKFQAGLFEISHDVTIVQLFEVLQKAKNKTDVRVTIPEGLRYDEEAEVIARTFSTVPNSKFSKAEFLDLVEHPSKATFPTEVANFLKDNKPADKNLEGFLFPETYLFAPDATATDVIAKMISTLNNKLTREDLDAIAASNYTLYQYLNVAAILERETSADDQKAMVADVIYKRLEKGIDGVKLLQMDSTMLYVIKDWTAYNKINDALKLKYKSDPYNTFYTPGLPPTPICSPGWASIVAAIYPTRNEYYYYLHDSNGGIHYGRTYSDHLNNIRKYL